MKKSAIAAADENPTLPTTEIVIGRKTYRMCFDYGALAKAERELNAQGANISVLMALPSLDLENTRIIFAASLRHCHPEIAYEDARKLLKVPYAMPVASAIADAWNKCLAEDDENGGDANPTEAAS